MPRGAAFRPVRWSRWVMAAAGLLAAQRALVGYLPCDDAFIAFRCARNLAEHGMPVYDLAVPVFSSTSLLYTAVLGLAGGLGAPIPVAAAVLGWVGDLVVCLLLVALSRRLPGSVALGLPAVVLWLTHPVVALNGAGGLETSWFVALLLATVLAVTERRFGPALSLALAAFWVRIDGVVLLPVVVWAWWRLGRPRISLVWAGAGTVAAVAYLGVTLTLFGSPIPHSLVAKAAATRPSWQGAAAAAASFVSATAGMLPAWYRHVSPHALLLPGLAVSAWYGVRGLAGAGFAFCARRRGRGAVQPGGAGRPERRDADSSRSGWSREDICERTLLGLAASYAALFVVSGRPSVPLFPWYHVPFVTLALLPGLSRSVGLGRRLAGVVAPRARATAVVLLSVGVAWLVAPWLAAAGGNGARGTSADVAGWVVSPSPIYLVAWHDVVRRPGDVLRELWPLVYQDLGLVLVALLVGCLALVVFAGQGESSSHGRRARCFLLLPAGAGCGGYVHGAAGRTGRAWLLLGVVAIVPLLLSRWDLGEKYERRERAYLALGKWVRDHVEPGETLGAREVGALGWAAYPLHVHDELGLVTPRALGVPRSDWVRSASPALVVETSLGSRASVRPEEMLPGYVLVESLHNRVYLRRDLEQAWIRSGPVLR